MMITHEALEDVNVKEGGVVMVVLVWQPGGPKWIWEKENFASLQGTKINKAA